MNKYEKAIRNINADVSGIPYFHDINTCTTTKDIEILQELVDKFNQLPSKEKVVETINYLLQEAKYKNHNKILKLKENLELLTNLINTIYGSE